MTFIGGARYGRSYFESFNLTYPFGKLTIEEDAIILRAGFFKKFHFKREQIVELSEYTTIVSRGLRIDHSIETTPPFIIFWSLNVKSVKSALVKSGYAFTNAEEKRENESDRLDDRVGLQKVWLSILTLLSCYLLGIFVAGGADGPAAMDAFIVSGITFLSLRFLFWLIVKRYGRKGR